MLILLPRSTRFLIFSGLSDLLWKNPIFGRKMLSRRLILSAAPLAKKALASNVPATSAVFGRLAHNGPPADYKQPSMDELEVPCGSWQESYDNYQRKYNIQLLFGTGFFLITFISCVLSGKFDMYLLAPEKPAKRDEMK